MVDGIFAISGPTGAGKSTLVQLIPRLYDVSGGEVLVGGHNVKDYKLNKLREEVSMVLQKNTLFSGTIEDNLKWGDPKASQDEIAKAKSAKVEADKIKAAEQVADSFFGKVAKPFLFAFEKGATALTKVKELATKLKTTYKDAGAKFKLAEGVASVLAAYSIGYGLLKTVKEISVDSFLSVKSNVQKMISVISNPKTYGWAKAGGLVLITLLAAHGMYRFGSVVVSFIKSKFNKDGKAEA